jgi:hypothetical protein
MVTKFKPNTRDFVPDSLADLLAFQKYDIVPLGFLSRADVAKICPGCAEEMQKAHMPLIREERFIDEINKRVALDIWNNTEAWAKAISENEVLGDLVKSQYAETYDLSCIGDDEIVKSDLQILKAQSQVKKVYENLFGASYDAIRAPSGLETSKRSYRHTVARERIAKCLKLSEDFEYGPDLMKAVQTEVALRDRGSASEQFTTKMRARNALAHVPEMKPAIGQKLALVDFVKAEPHASISGWAAKMKKEGGEHPHAWCAKKAAKFASDPNAFCASVHMAAYGKTPMQRKAEKKG